VMTQLKSSKRLHLLSKNLYQKTRFETREIDFSQNQIGLNWRTRQLTEMLGQSIDRLCGIFRNKLGFHKALHGQSHPEVETDK